MKKKCDCYHIQKKTRYTYNQFTGSPIPHDIEVGVCWGTRETDECDCGGDRTKCDFYPEVREKAKKEQKESNCLIVTYDCCSPDIPTLCVAKKDGDKVKVLNTIQGDKAFGMYHCLTGGADLIQKHGHWYLLDECANAGVYCSVCNKKVYKEHYANVKEKSKFCPNCGAIMDEKFRML